jgi:hypothetical protein
VNPWNWLFGLLGAGPRLHYNMAEPKQAEAAILADIASGALQFKRRTRHKMTHRQVDVLARNASLHYEVDYPSGIPGTFSYLYVQGADYIDKDPSVFDGRRVAQAMQTGVDPGPQPVNRSLYWM